MKVNNKHYRSIWYEKDSNTVKIIDQRELPYSFKESISLNISSKLSFVA